MILFTLSFLFYPEFLLAGKNLDDKGTKPEVFFDISTIDKIFKNPNFVLEDVQNFWKTEPVLIAEKKWEPPGYPIHYGEFERRVRELSKQDQAERIKNANYQFALKIQQSVPEFRKKGLDHLLSYLPKDFVLKSKVLLGCFIYLGNPEPRFSPSAFVVKNTVVFNVSHKVWKFKTSEILHLLTHELVHVSHHHYHKTLPLQEADTRQKLINHILWKLHNEGMATYIAYTVQDSLPTEDERDYKLIENIKELKDRFGMVNELLKKAGKEPLKKMHKSVIDLGITKRAFYVTGAYMAREIEKKIGKNALVDAFSKNEANFTQLYNSIATPYDESIHIPFILRWPSMIKGEKRTPTMMSSVDLMPTLLSLMGLDIPSGIQGLDLSHAALGKKGNEPESVYLQILGPGWPHRGKWVGYWRGVRTNRHVYARWHANEYGPKLFDREKDPLEMNNLLWRNPYKKDPPKDWENSLTLQKEMEELLQEWIKKTDDPFDTGERDPKTGMLLLGQKFSHDKYKW